MSYSHNHLKEPSYVLLSETKLLQEFQFRKEMKNCVSDGLINFYTTSLMHNTILDGEQCDKIQQNKEVNLLVFTC